jgi:hypothetical protein|tara:strand:- start:4646 stop:4870 length:225 start_codon:yes stop_codon:yes gene_type:complete
MMGWNWQQDPQRSVEEKFAWWPIRSGSRKRIWLEKYYEQHTYYDDNGKPPIKGPYWSYIYTKNEFLMEIIKNER